MCGTAITVRDTYKKCSDCGYIEFEDEYKETEDK